jgi:hypothetical protein
MFITRIFTLLCLAFFLTGCGSLGPMQRYGYGPIGVPSLESILRYHIDDESTEIKFKQSATMYSKEGKEFVTIGQPGVFVVTESAVYFMWWGNRHYEYQTLYKLNLDKIKTMREQIHEGLFFDDFNILVIVDKHGTETGFSSGGIRAGKSTIEELIN